MYQVHRWAPEDPDLWLRMGVLSFLMTDRAWLKRVGLEDGHQADQGAVNAELYLAKAVALSGRGARYLFWAGWVAHKLYQRDERTLLGEAAATGYPYAHAALARLELAAATPGYAERALQHLDAAIAVLPESARFHYDRGACLAGLGREAEAVEAFRRARGCPALSAAPDAAGRYLAAEFQADGTTVGDLAERLYPHLA
jgi:tetratricopeptide (TPR) repeat protein